MAAGDLKEFGEVSPTKYEYLDNPADIQLHCWGDTIKEAFEQAAVAMYAYMTEIETVDMVEKQEIEAEGEDMMSLLFHFLDEFLFLFSAEPFFIARFPTDDHKLKQWEKLCHENKVVITEFDTENFRIKAEGYGETFDLKKHPQGTEVKAITYSNMQIYDKDNQHEVFVIIDI